MATEGGIVHAEDTGGFPFAHALSFGLANGATLRIETQKLVVERVQYGHILDNLFNICSNVGNGICD